MTTLPMTAGEARKRADRRRRARLLRSPSFEPATESDEMASGPETNDGRMTRTRERPQITLALVDIEHFCLEIDGHHAAPCMTATEKLTSSCGATSTTRPGYSRDASAAFA